jgi:hypothetical protein
MIRILISFLLISTKIYSYSPPNNEKPSYETYKLIEFPQRQKVIKFLNLGLLISEQCVSIKNSKFTRRNCGAWKPMDVLENNQYKKYFIPNKVLPDPNNPRLVSLFICIQSGGQISTEVNEFGKYGRDIEPLDFCQFSDNSILALISIEKYLQTLAKAGAR